MSTILQKTKLFPPVNRFRLVERPRLFDRLNHILLPDCKVGIISAPAGSGKTTVINQWLINQKGIQSAWISLDDRDNDLTIFLRYLIESLQSIHPDIGKEAKTLVNLPGLDLDEFVTLLTNDLAEHEDQFVLILDDFHVINNSRIVEVMSLLLEAKPVWVKIVLLTREDPGIPLARWRVRGQLVELRQNDLRFTPSETVTFLNQCMELGLSIEQIKLLEDTTEGWIAGLQLAAVSLQHSKNKEQFVRDFSGTHRFVLDYLMDEVFLNQPLEIQRFLLETAILENMNADLCAAVTGNSSSEAQTILEHLVRTNLFLFELDNQRHWYRYHHLFKDLLMARLQSLQKEQINQLFCKASDWYEKQGEAQSAVEFALKGQNLTLAADLIEKHISKYWQTADWDFMSLLKQLPEEEITKRPSLCLHKAWINVITGQMNEVLPLVNIAESQLADVDREVNLNDKPLRAFAKILRTYMIDFKNQSVVLDPSLAEAYAGIPDDFAGMKNSVAILLGTMHYMENEFSNAMWYFEDALERDKRLKGTTAIPISVHRMVWVYQRQGQLRKAMELTRKYDKYVRQRGVRGYYIAGVLNLLMGEILLEWNQLEEAEYQIREGLRLIKDWPNPSIKIIGNCLLTRLQIALNDLPEAKNAYLQVEELIPGHQFHPEFINILNQTQLDLWIKEMNLLELESFVSKKSALLPHALTFRNEAALIGLCKAWLALGDFQKARTLLSRLAAFAEGRKGNRIIILLLLAIAYSEKSDKAEQYLEEALRLAEPEGYIRTFLEMGEPLWKILKNWLTKNQNTSDEVLRAYAYKIILAFEKGMIRDSRKEKEIDLPEPLSKRELEVLQLVAKGFTNKEIASKLVISIRTVKKHIENIHGKLGVQNRTQATTRARSLGLLESNK